MQQGDAVVIGERGIGQQGRKHGQRIMGQGDGAKGGEKLRPELLALKFPVEQPERNQDSEESDRGPDIVKVAFDEVHPGPAKLRLAPTRARRHLPPLLQGDAERKSGFKSGAPGGFTLWSGAGAAQGCQIHHVAGQIAEHRRLVAAFENLRLGQVVRGLIEQQARFFKLALQFVG